jgi:hypothetical protein
MQKILQSNIYEGSSTGFTLLHVGAVMNWHTLLTNLLRRRDRWLYVSS